MLSQAAIESLQQGRHGDPFSVLGLHEDGAGLTLRVLLPAAVEVTAW